MPINRTKGACRQRDRPATAGLMAGRGAANLTRPVRASTPAVASLVADRAAHTRTGKNSEQKQNNYHTTTKLAKLGRNTTTIPAPRSLLKQPLRTLESRPELRARRETRHKTRRGRPQPGFRAELTHARTQPSQARSPRVYRKKARRRKE